MEASSRSFSLPPNRSSGGHRQRKNDDTVPIEGQTWKGEAQKQKALLPSLVLGSALAFFSRVRSTNSACKLLQGRGSLHRSGRLPPRLHLRELYRLDILQSFAYSKKTLDAAGFL